MRRVSSRKERRDHGDNRKNDGDFGWQLRDSRIFMDPLVWTDARLRIRDLWKLTPHPQWKSYWLFRTESRTWRLVSRVETVGKIIGMADNDDRVILKRNVTPIILINMMIVADEDEDMECVVFNVAPTEVVLGQYAFIRHARLGCDKYDDKIRKLYSDAICIVQLDFVQLFRKECALLRSAYRTKLPEISQRTQDYIQRAKSFDPNVVVLDPIDIPNNLQELKAYNLGRYLHQIAIGCRNAVLNSLELEKDVNVRAWLDSSPGRSTEVEFRGMLKDLETMGDLYLPAENLDTIWIYCAHLDILRETIYQVLRQCHAPQQGCKFEYTHERVKGYKNARKERPFAKISRRRMGIVILELVQLGLIHEGEGGYFRVV